MSFGMEYGFGGGFDPMGFNQFGGGGFMPSDTASASPEKKQANDKKSVIPVTIKQFLEAETDSNGNIFIDGKEIYTLKVVGFISTITEHTTNVSYKINDGTGELDCKLWTSKDGGGPTNSSQMQRYSYVRIYGNPREYDSKREVIIYDITAITDFNEVTHHLLDVILSHELAMKGPLQSISSQSTQLSYTPVKSGMLSSQLTPGVPIGNLSINNSQNNQKKELTHHVIDAFKEGKHKTQGLNVDEVVQILKRRGINAIGSQVHSITRYLVDEGNLYSTVDDCYKLTSEDF